MQNASTINEPAPKRLAFVITELEPGGAERCCAELAARIDRSRFSSVVYSLGPPPHAERRSLVARLLEANVPIHFLGFQTAFQYFGAVHQLAKMLREQQAEIVQTFLFHANVVGAQAARAAGVRRVVTGIRVADPRWWRTSLEYFMTRSADRYVCVSQNV